MDAASLAYLQQLRGSGAIRAISIDLDDTLWPIWPVIAKAEEQLMQWLTTRAPRTANSLATVAAVRALREEIMTLRPDLAGDAAV